MRANSWSDVFVDFAKARRDLLLGDPGPRMLEAAEQLREKVYGPPRR